ncbi:MAG: gliding motility lipoprotein GldB [Flavobacteriales bacterium]
MKYSLLLFTFFIVACTSGTKNSKLEKKIAATPIEFELVRFDRIFGTASPEDLPQLKQRYPEFFPKKYNDSIWINRMQDTLQQQLFSEVMKVFPDQEKLRTPLKSLFQHIDYYFPEFKTPRVYTNIDFVDYRNKVLLSEPNLIILLDTYLGENHPFYEGIPIFLSKNMKASQIIPDVAEAYAKKWVRPISQPTFLAQMIYYGKILYLKELWLPQTKLNELIGYTEQEMKWAKANETEVWRNFVENEYLFSTQPKLKQRFISPAPFSKFYLEIDNESPGMIGKYMGWQIVKAFMNKNSISVRELMTIPADEIFNKSKYKPKK